MRFASCYYFSLFRNILHKVIVYSACLISLFFTSRFLPLLSFNNFQPA